ncbi:MAG TPA: DUF488 domain-containing protein [Anaeromyxobacteraceae bacterium]|nr:DUF488 domain-containing protein [Anaeromyxobacteraceae bacterium]
MLAIGHSTRPVEELISLLRAHGVRVLADIRTIPRSRHNPQFEASALAPALAAAGIRYVHLPRLGGLRRARADSPNGAWRNASFRGYADHMLTPEFAEGLDELRALAKEGPVAIMCAEAVPWRCHRSLVADALWARGVVVGHVTGHGTPRPHRLTPFAVVSGREVTYPGEPGEDASGAAGGGARERRGATRTRGAARQPRSAPRGGGGAPRSRAPGARSRASARS